MITLQVMWGNINYVHIRSINNLEWQTLITKTIEEESFFELQL